MRQSDLSGIVNGIDTDIFNPAVDTALVSPYTEETLELKLKNKEPNAYYRIEKYYL